MNYSDYRNAVGSIVWKKPERQKIERTLSKQEFKRSSGILTNSSRNALPHNWQFHAVIFILGILLNWLLKWISRFLI